LGTGTAASTYVPYTGATTGLNLGSQTFTTTGNTSLANASTTALTVSGVTTLSSLANAFLAVNSSGQIIATTTPQLAGNYITALTGISDEMVRGKRIDDEAVSKFIAEAGIVIAHNAGFDRKFMEKRFPVFEEKSWGCSQREVPWREEGIESAKLEYIAYRSGFFYEGHRADIDCLAGIEILSHPLPNSDQLPLALLLENARKTTYVVWAVGSPFETKDRLKERGYRWNGGEDGRPKSWYKEVDQIDQAAEVEFLKAGGYFWNGGIFLCPVGLYLSELEKNEPAIGPACRAARGSTMFPWSCRRPAWWSRTPRRASRRRHW